MTSFRVLGPVEAWTDERRLVLGGPQQLKLLAFLLLNANRAVSADTVVDAVWGPERDGAAKRLHMGVLRLRRSLAPLDGQDRPRLRTVSGGYLLALGPGELDAEVFAGAVREGCRGLEERDPVRASEILAHALELWRGPPLAEVAFEDFARGEIGRLEELRLVALETRIDADLRLGRHALLIPELEGLVVEQPSRERIAGELMTALYRSGRQADALEFYQRTRVHLAEQLGLEPGPALRLLQEQVLAQAPSLQGNLVFDQGTATTGAEEQRETLDAPLRPLESLPIPATPTIGRREEMDGLCGLLTSSETRLVSLTGPGGVGKTRLALAVAHAVRPDFLDGACWVELAAVSGGDDVEPTIARALAVTPMPDESTRAAICRWLGGRRVLLVLDNFEHVLQAADLVAEVLRVCPGPTILVTSRAPLDLAGEHRVLVGPLAWPDPTRDAAVAEVESAPASALFLAAARRHDRGFAINRATAPIVAGICARLEGLPLALELAAARTAAVGVRELAERLQDAVSDLGTGPRDAPTRQRTLEATMGWSYRLLDEDERCAFVAFAVFAGGATIDAARAVTGATLETFEALIAKSMLYRRQQPDGHARLAMLETMRQYALQRLVDGADARTVSRRHFDYYVQLVERTVPRLARIVR